MRTFDSEHRKLLDWYMEQSWKIDNLPCEYYESRGLDDSEYTRLSKYINQEYRRQLRILEEKYKQEIKIA